MRPQGRDHAWELAAMNFQEAIAGQTAERAMMAMKVSYQESCGAAAAHGGGEEDPPLHSYPVPLCVQGPRCRPMPRRSEPDTRQAGRQGIVL